MKNSYKIGSLTHKLVFGQHAVFHVLIRTTGSISHRATWNLPTQESRNEGVIDTIVGNASHFCWPFFYLSNDNHSQSIRDVLAVEANTGTIIMIARSDQSVEINKQIKFVILQGSLGSFFDYYQWHQNFIEHTAGKAEICRSIGQYQKPMIFTKWSQF